MHPPDPRHQSRNEMWQVRWTEDMAQRDEGSTQLVGGMAQYAQPLLGMQLLC